MKHSTVANPANDTDPTKLGSTPWNDSHSLEADENFVTDTEKTNLTELTDGSETTLHSHAGGGGATVFTDLTDTPAAYTGKAGYMPVVNSGETALEFVTAVQAFDGGAFSDTHIDTVDFDGGAFV